MKNFTPENFTKIYDVDHSAIFRIIADTYGRPAADAVADKAIALALGRALPPEVTWPAF